MQRGKSGGATQGNYNLLKENSFSLVEYAGLRILIRYWNVTLLPLNRGKER
jgi:hypothetical protein